MSEEESIVEQPTKKRKLEDATQKQILSDSTDSGKDQNEPLQDSKEAEESPSVSQDKLRNFVTPEELEQLRRFHVLDEVKSNDEDSNDENSDDSDGKSVELPDEEIEMMLDADLPDSIKGGPKTREKPFITRQKVLLEEKGINHFEVLPLDWIMVRHMSGMPIYMQRSTRVCTLSKPYFLGKNNTRRHDIPISAIPCYAYRRALEEEEKQKEIDRRIEEQIRNGTWPCNYESYQNTICPGAQSKNISCNSTDQPGTASGTQSQYQKLGSSTRQGQETTEPKSNKVSEPTTGQEMENKDHKIQDSATLQKPQSKDTETIKCMRHLMSSGQESSASANLQPYETISQQISDVGDPQKPELSNQKIPDFPDKSSESSCPKFQSEDLLRETLEIKEEILQDISRSDCQVSDDSKKEDSSEKEKESNSNSTASEPIPLSRQPVVLPGGIVMPPPRVETINTSWKTQHLNADQINDYCKKLFKFKTVNIMHFKRWADRRKYTKARKTLQYPTLPEGTKLITIPAQPATPGQENGGKSTKRDWVMNMNDRSYLSVFHEYVRRALQKQPVYHFRQLENAAQPYQAIVYIGGMQYGVGYGSSKRQAKSAAARASIHILIPEMKDELDAAGPQDTDKTQPDFHDFFDLVGIEDPRITEFCAATCEPSPHAILRTCLLRNFGAGDRLIHTEMKKLEFQKIELTMKVGKHSASVICKNKKTAKQRASQAILQALHPHVRSWGSLLRLYGSKSEKSCKEKKLEEQQITLLQDKARHNEPNYAVLDKLRHEMRKLRERDEAVVPIGTLLVKDDLPTHSGSNLNNVDL
ncbi:unnamed protein product [Arctia plantaginis]|uniref:DRBM domain-containing protein n=1 Tax=Arctia plantaginis TaxID=874455 RepID=A0A8S0YL63_ARCPL|nr:unnamed protein product [Arctia plantaginis]